MDDLLSEFLTEAESGLARIESDLERAKGRPDDPTFIETLRAFIDMIAGTSGFLELARLRRLAEAGAAALGALAEPLPAAAAALIRELLAVLASRLAELRESGRESPGDDMSLIFRLSGLTGRRSPPIALASPPTARPPLPQPGAVTEMAIREPEGDGGVAALVGELITVRNGLMSLRQGDGMEMELPLERLDAVTSALAARAARSTGRARAGIGLRLLAVLLIPCAGRLLAFPQASVEAVGPAPAGDSGPVGINHNGRILPLFPLDRIFDSEEGERADDSHILIVKTGASEYALVAGRPLDPTEIVVEALPGLFGNVPWLAGGAVSAEGRVALVIDPTGLAKALGAAPKPPRLLLVDDSAFFRNLLEPVLTVAGYEVTAAASGPEALALRDQGVTFDVMVSDLTMPGQSGIELLREVRVEGRWAGLPVIGLSSGTAEIGSDEIPEFDAVVPKFDRDALVGALARLAARPAEA